MLNVRKTTKTTAPRATAAKPVTAPEATEEKTMQTTENTTQNETKTVDTKEKAMQISAPVAPIAIRANVPLPPAMGGGGKAKYPWETLGVGESFFVPGAKVETFYTLTSAASKKYEGRKYTSRKMADGEPWGFDGVAGVAVWRTA